MSSAKRTSILLEDESRSEESSSIGTSTQDFIVDDDSPPQLQDMHDLPLVFQSDVVSSDVLPKPVVTGAPLSNTSEQQWDTDVVV